MTALAWDQVGERTFQTGVDRGVLYLPDNAVAWNGLTGLTESFGIENNQYYQDGEKYLDHQVLGDFAATLKAFTYPDEFNECIGIQTEGYGLYIHEQRFKSFGLSYRTKIGDDLLGSDRDYLIHVLYNLRAVPSDNAFATVGAQVTPMEFSWAITSTPEAEAGYRSTAHVSIKSSLLETELLQEVEQILYGSDEDEPYLPTIHELIELINGGTDV